MRNRAGILLTLVAGGALMGSPASAGILTFTAALSPEVVGATGSGSVTVTVDDVARTLSIAANWAGLSGVTTVAHIHCCLATPGTGTVGVAVTPGTLPGFPVGVSSGDYNLVDLDMRLTSSYTAAFVTASGGTIDGAFTRLLANMADGRAYFNVHSNTFPGGEIRGFLRQVPEPATLALMALGLLGVGAARRRQAA